MKIYLAGGQKSTPLRESILAELLAAGYEVLDPASHGLVDEQAYTAWDLDAIKRSDAVVAFMEPCNPSGYGMSLEIGYAKGIGRPVFFIDAMADDPRRRYFGMVRVSASTLLPADFKRGLRKALATVWDY